MSLAFRKSFSKGPLRDISLTFLATNLQSILVELAALSYSQLARFETSTLKTALTANSTLAESNVEKSGDADEDELGTDTDGIDEAGEMQLINLRECSELHKFVDAFSSFFKRSSCLRCISKSSS